MTVYVPSLPTVFLKVLDDLLCDINVIVGNTLEGKF